MARSAHRLSLPPYRAIVLGWHGSRERHLRPLAKHHEARGADVIVHAPRTFRAMVPPRGWQREAEPLAAEILARDPRPLVVHAMSNAGFWSSLALLERLGDRARLAGTILDSAPGFPERVSFLFTARYASRAMLPALLHQLGLPPAHTHPLFRPPIAALLGAWHLVSRRQVRYMESSQPRMRALHRDLPLLGIYGGADELVLPHYVERFLDGAKDAGAKVERLFFPDGGHVRHLVEHRAEYLAAVDRFLTRALAGV